ncbi:MAG: putative Ig domain-containing protein, partial [Tunicatimonas sp.]|uniref:putative Ig domain-containing protein n=1 Tax=Tunicatimonas sp. TaxID=1940096 RepID=UPI003C782959
LNARINGKGIEQRPFVSPDRKYLFFSRTSVTQVNGSENYESDIYWVSTKSIFKPYLYNNDVKTDPEVKYNEPFQLNLPKDLFKDVDDLNLFYEASLANNNELPGWIRFDANNLSMSGTWKSKKPITIKLTATDGAGNSGDYKFQLKGV